MRRARSYEAAASASKGAALASPRCAASSPAMCAWLPAKATKAPLTPQVAAMGARSPSSSSHVVRSSRAIAAIASSRTPTDQK